MNTFSWPELPVIKVRYARRAGRPCTYTHAQAWAVWMWLDRGLSKQQVARKVGLPRHTVDNIDRRRKNGKPIPTAIAESVPMDKQPDSTKNEGSEK